MQIRQFNQAVAAFLILFSGGRDKIPETAYIHLTVSLQKGIKKFQFESH